jgi:flagellar basal body L-ring protein FlgH
LLKAEREGRVEGNITVSVLNILGNGGAIHVKGKPRKNKYI